VIYCDVEGAKSSVEDQQIATIADLIESLLHIASSIIRARSQRKRGESSQAPLSLREPQAGVVEPSNLPSRPDQDDRYRRKR
jgi:hypothetical protein